MTDVYTTKIPRSIDVGRFLFIKGTVIRTGTIKMLDTKKIYTCGTCKKNFAMRNDPEQFNVIPKPFKCFAPQDDQECTGSKFKEVIMDAGEVSSTKKVE